MSVSYNYVAVNEMGRKMRGNIAAENEVDLENRLAQLGLELIDCKVAKEKKASGFSKIRQQDMIIMCLHLEQLSRASVPLLDAIADVRDSTESDKLRDVMAGVYESVKGGEYFSQALSHYPKVFNEVFIGLVEAGQKTGDLSEAFLRLADHMKWTAELRRKVRKAMGYPIFLLVVMGTVTSVLMLFVVPKLVDFIVSQGFDIPIHTQALIWTSEAFTNFWYLIFGVPIVMITTFFSLYRTSDAFAYRIDSIILKLPVIGPTMRKINMARFTHFFAVMFNSGIDILESLDSARNVVGNRVLQDSITTVRRSVSEGSSITAALRMSDQFPNLVVRMFKVGEESGNMNEALENVNFFFNREVNDSVDTMVGMIQPALTIVMGVLMLWVMSAIFGPLYQSFQHMKF